MNKRRAQPRAEAFGKARDVVRVFGRQFRQRGWRGQRQHAIRIVLNERIAVQRFRAQVFARLFEVMRIRAVFIQLQRKKLHAKLRRDRVDAGIGERLHADQLARSYPQGHQARQNAVNAGRN